MDTLRGIALMTLAMAVFAVEDMFIKLLSARMPLGQILLFIGLGGTLAFGILARIQGVDLLNSALLSRPILLRSLGEMVGTVCFVLSISLLPMSTVASVLQAAPLVVTLGGALFLNEPVGWRRWSAIAVGFMGVLLILRPGAESFEPVALVALVATFSLALRDLATRAVPRSTPSLLLTTSGFGMVALAGLILLPLGGPVVWPDATGWLWLFCALGAGMAAYAAITAAMRIGELGAVTPFRYTRLIFSIAIGVTVFGERPDALTLSGAGIILLAGLYTLSRARRAARTPA